MSTTNDSTNNIIMTADDDNDVDNTVAITPEMTTDNNNNNNNNNATTVAITPEDNNNNNNDNDSSKPKKKRASRACTRCSFAKVRCEGGIPCARCIRLDSRNDCEIKPRKKPSTHRHLVYPSPWNNKFKEPNADFDMDALRIVRRHLSLFKEINDFDDKLHKFTPFLLTLMDLVDVKMRKVARDRLEHTVSSIVNSTNRINPAHSIENLNRIPLGVLTIQIIKDDNSNVEIITSANQRLYDILGYNNEENKSQIETLSNIRGWRKHYNDDNVQRLCQGFSDAIKKDKKHFQVYSIWKDLNNVPVPTVDSVSLSDTFVQHDNNFTLQIFINPVELHSQVDTDTDDEPPKKRVKK